MVGEFPELQGVMGRYYALHQKEKPEVADAIRDHYLPLGHNSPVPTKPISICVALADKFAVIRAMFKAGEKPTGSKDPFALRRSALGAIRIILDNNLRIPLKEFLNDELLSFFGDRLKVQLKENGIRHDVIDAVMANGDDDLVRVVARAKAVQDFLGTDDGKNLLAAYKRAVNILGIEEKKDNTKYTGDVKVDLFQQEEEKTLFAAFTKTTPDVTKSFEKEDFAAAMATLATLRQPVDKFFDKVMVNAEDKKIRANRLSILSQMRATLDKIANFSLIEG
jgi:glycyl-tRNA synthetase beta chain